MACSMLANGLAEWQQQQLLRALGRFTWEGGGGWQMGGGRGYGQLGAAGVQQGLQQVSCLHDNSRPADCWGRAGFRALCGGELMMMSADGSEGALAVYSMVTGEAFACWELMQCNEVLVNINRRCSGRVHSVTLAPPQNSVTLASSSKHQEVQ